TISFQILRLDINSDFLFRPSNGFLAKCKTDLLRDRFHRGSIGRHEGSFVDTVINSAPADGLLSEADEPDEKSHCVPYRNQRDAFPDARLFHAPDAYQPGHCDSEREIDAKVD